jgi:hypothetical protein
VIELPPTEAPAEARARAAARLVERFGGGPADGLPADGSAVAWVEWLAARLPGAPGAAAVEHLFGVLPLDAAVFAPAGLPAAVGEGELLGALALFTPSADLGWGTAALAAAADGSGWRLRGAVRIAGAAADGAIVPVATAPGERRLAWLDARAAGVERRGARQGGAVRPGAPCWLAVDGALVGADRVSPPVSFAAGSGLRRSLEGYAGVWALAAALAARAAVRALRRAARTTLYEGTSLGTSQLVATAITALEVEADLAAAAAREGLAAPAAAAGPAGEPEPASMPAPAAAPGAAGLALATAAARVLAAVAARTAELRELAGLELAGEPAAAPVAGWTAMLGGALMLESELAGALGIGGGSATEGGA